MAFLGRNRRLISLHLLAFIASATMYYALLYWVVEFLVRKFDVSRPVAGGTFGTILLVGGLVGCALPGPFVARLLQRGVSNVTNRISLASAIMALPVAVAVPLVTDYAVSLALLAILMFVISLPLSLGISTMQIIAPVHLQGRIVAVYLTATNLAAFSMGPLLIGLVNDHFHGGASLGRALAEVAAVTYLLAALFLWGTLAPLRNAVRKAQESESLSASA